MARTATFVTAVGRLFVVAAAVGLVVAVAQNVVAWSSPSSTPPDAPARVLLVALPVFCAATLIVSLAFLRRRPWARAALVGLVALAFFGHLFVLVFALGWGRSWLSEAPADGPASFQGVLQVVRVVNIAYPMAACAFLGWIILRLMSRGVRNEFQPARVP